MPGARRQAAARAARRTRSSSPGVSTANAPLTAIASRRAASRSSASSTVACESPPLASTNSCAVASFGRARARSRRPRPLARDAQLRLVADAYDADRADVALEQRVHRLRRRERDELHPRRRVAELRRQVAQRLRDARRDARRRHRASSGTLACAWISSGFDVTATAFVNVPPTSTPILITRSRARHLAAGAAPAGGRTSRARRRRTRRAGWPARAGPRASGGCRSARRGRRSRAQPPCTGVTPIQSPSCSERTAFPTNATESTRSSIAAVISIGFSGSRLPSLRIAYATTASARAAATAPATIHSRALREERERLVEERGLEALAVDGGEPEAGERDRRAGSDRRRDARPHELHPVPVLEPRDEPEGDREQDHHRDDRRDPLEQLALERRDLDHERGEQPRRDRRQDRRGRRPITSGLR